MVPHPAERALGDQGIMRPPYGQPTPLKKETGSGSASYTRIGIWLATLDQRKRAWRQGEARSATLARFPPEGKRLLTTMLNFEEPTAPLPQGLIIPSLISPLEGSELSHYSGIGPTLMLSQLWALQESWHVLPVR